MAVNRNQDSGVGTYEPGEPPPPTRHCCNCGGPWDTPRPVKSTGGHLKYGDQAFIPHPGADGLCWSCWDNGRRA